MLRALDIGLSPQQRTRVLPHRGKQICTLPEEQTRALVNAVIILKLTK